MVDDIYKAWRLYFSQISLSYIQLAFNGVWYIVNKFTYICKMAEYYLLKYCPSPMCYFAQNIEWILQ